MTDCGHEFCGAIDLGRCALALPKCQRCEAPATGTGTVGGGFICFVEWLCPACFKRVNATAFTPVENTNLGQMRREAGL